MYVINTPQNIYYAIFLMFWTTWLVESWKRKESMIGHKWLVRNFKDATTERKEFRAALDVDLTTKKKWMVSVRKTYMRQLFVGIPTTCFFIALVIGVQILQRLWRDYNDDLAQPGGPYYNEEIGKPAIPYHIKYAPALVNSIVISIFGMIYKKVAMFLVESENHRYAEEFENSLINKIYMFYFINAYISNYIYAFWRRDFLNVAINLIIVMVGTQVATNVVEYCTDRFWTKHKVDKVS